ncbi:MAG: DUF58 domain-containing protein [Cyclobacteriaceae bacterium]
MPKKLSRLKHKFRYYGLFIPLKKNGLFFLLFLALTILILRSQTYSDDSFIKPFFELFAWVGGVFIALIIGLGLLYTLACWIYLLANKKQVTVNLNVGLEDGQKGQVGKVPVQVAVSKIWMPLMGYIKVRLVFKDGELSGPVILNTFSKGWKELLPKEGQANLWLTDRQQYGINGFVISCEDFLQFFRFSMSLDFKKAFYISPLKNDIPVEELKPTKSQEDVEKVKTTKRVEGDYLNYKDFESGDDVRRIVWKIFAKNKELVVRIPEIINPYASHVALYSSFYNIISGDLNGNYSKGILNFYKDIIYNICLSLEKSDRKVQFNLDQPLMNGIVVEKRDELAYKLSCANWQKELAASELQVPKSEAVICVSSLIPAEDLEEVINKGKVNLFVVRVSKYLNDQNLFNWKNLFIRRDQKGEINKLKWLFSKTRRRIRQNEKRIEELVSNNNFKGQVI